MAVLDATVGGSNANSYASVATADDYFDSRLNATIWTSAADRQDAALITATSRIEQERFKGSRASSVQRLKWPRVGVVDDDGAAVDDATLPREVVEATLELTLVYLRAGTTDPTAPTGLEQFKALDVGPVSLTLRDQQASEAVAGDPAYTEAVKREQLPPQVQRLLRPFLTTDVPLSATLPATSRIVRG